MDYETFENVILLIGFLFLFGASLLIGWGLAKLFGWDVEE